MKLRISDISGLPDKCTGCMACVDACPMDCISSVVGEDGFLYYIIEDVGCVKCGRCYSACPIENAEKNSDEQHLFAAYQVTADGQNRGSSGGMFELLAEYCLSHGYYVCGAAFEGTILRHHIIQEQSELLPLLKSKYIQSNMTGIYRKLITLLEQGERVFFCGTPCQASALINVTPLEFRRNLLVADIICHGVPSQTVFDKYIDTLKKKHGGEVTQFSFRVKNNRYRHPHGFSYQVEKNGKVREYSGIYSHSSFYNAFKSYSIFRNGCYNCSYATVERVSDITLADFWGIEKYDFCGNMDGGVSMVITNTSKGAEAFSAVREKTVSKEFPLQYGIDSNHCLTHQTRKPPLRDAIIHGIATEGYEKTAKTYFGCSVVHRLWWWLPSGIRNFLRKRRGK